MTAPAGYFDRGPPKIKTPDQMMEALKARTRSAVGQSPKALVWLEPEGRTQRAQDQPYEIREAKMKDLIMYYAWLTNPKPKLLGYSTDPTIARTHCEAHHLSRVSA